MGKRRMAQVRVPLLAHRHPAMPHQDVCPYAMSDAHRIRTEVPRMECLHLQHLTEDRLPLSLPEHRRDLVVRLEQHQSVAGVLGNHGKPVVIALLYFCLIPPVAECLLLDLIGPLVIPICRICCDI